MFANIKNIANKYNEGLNFNRDFSSPDGFAIFA